MSKIMRTSIKVSICTYTTYANCQTLSFVLLPCASLAASRILLQQLLACLKFTLDSEDLLCWYKQKSVSYELWQQCKQLKTMEMSEA